MPETEVTNGMPVGNGGTWRACAGARINHLQNPDRHHFTTKHVTPAETEYRPAGSTRGFP